MKRMLGVTTVAIFVLFMMGTTAAQSGPACKVPFTYVTGSGSATGGLGDPWPIPIGSVCGGNCGNFCALCDAMSPACAPAAAANETCIACNAARTAQASHPIDLATGNTYISQGDLSVPGLGGGLSLSRTWNSMLPAVQNGYAPMFGPGWRSTYEERLIFNSSDRYLKYARSDGSVWSFGLVSMSPNIYRTAAPANDTTTITTNADTTAGVILSWILVSKGGEKRIFDPVTGLLLSIIDRNGNTTQLTYDSSNRLTTVTDPAMRHLNFSYSSPTSNLVTGVTSDVGITLTYSYDAQGRLVQVTRPDASTLHFEFDAQSHITAVKDSDGKILESHTYDIFGRGLTGVRANGVDSVTITYP